MKGGAREKRPPRGVEKRMLIFSKEILERKYAQQEVSISTDGYEMG